MSCTKFYYKYKHETLRNFFHHLLAPPANSQNPHPRPTRNIQAPRILEETDATTYNDTLLATIHTNTKSSKHCLKHNLISLINTHDIPKDITDQINTLSYTAFSNYTRKYFITQYKTICMRQQCHSCHQPAQN